MISMNVIVERIQYARTNGHNIGITYKINQFRTGYFCPKLVLIHKHEKKDFKMVLSKILCKWKQDSVVSLFLYLDSVFKYKHKLVHNQSPV